MAIRGWPCTLISGSLHTGTGEANVSTVPYATIKVVFTIFFLLFFSRTWCCLVGSILISFSALTSVHLVSSFFRFLSICMPLAPENMIFPLLAASIVMVALAFVKAHHSLTNTTIESPPNHLVLSQLSCLRFKGVRNLGLIYCLHHSDGDPIRATCIWVSNPDPEHSNSVLNECVFNAKRKEVASWAQRQFHWENFLISSFHFLCILTFTMSPVVSQYLMFPSLPDLHQPRPMIDSLCYT